MKGGRRRYSAECKQEALILYENSDKTLAEIEEELGISPDDRAVPCLPPIVRTWFDDENFARLERARELAEQKGATAAQVALAYVLDQAFPTFALIGPQTIDELRDVLPALDNKLTPDELRWLNLEN